MAHPGIYAFHITAPNEAFQSDSEGTHCINWSEHPSSQQKQLQSLQICKSFLQLLLKCTVTLIDMVDCCSISIVENSAYTANISKPFVCVTYLIIHKPSLLIWLPHVQSYMWLQHDTAHCSSVWASAAFCRATSSNKKFTWRFLK